MAANTQTKTGLVSTIVTGIQSSSSALLDFAVGSILLAIAEAFADVVLWLQGLILYAAALCRASTCKGADLDSWFAQFGWARSGAVAATTPLTFARFNTTLATYIPVGATVQSADGTQTFTVGTDTTNGAYSVNAGGAGVPGYLLPAGTSSVTCTSTASTAGAAGNVLANTLTVITAPIVGVDYVTNAASATGGANAQTDAQALIGFQQWEASLSRATLAAVQYAALSVQPGLFVGVLENISVTGSAQNGTFTLMVDDGSGTPPAALLTAVANAVNLYRGLGIPWAVLGPTLVSAPVVIQIRLAAGYTSAVVLAQVQAAILAYINTTGFGATVSFNRLAQVAFDASPGVANVTGITLAGATVDLVATSVQVIRCASVTASTY